MDKKYQLVIQTAFLGDLILSIPLLAKIKEKYPEDELILICKSGLGDFFLKEKIVDHIFEIKKNDRKSYRKVIQQIKLFKIENLFCIHRSFRSQLMSMQIHAQKKIGFQSLFGLFVFNQLVPFQKKWPEALRQLFILTANDEHLKKRMGQQDWSCLNQVMPDGQLNAIPLEFQSAVVPNKSQRATKRIAIFPGSVWATKRWTIEGFATVANFFIQRDYEVVLMGGADEKELCLAVKKISTDSQVLAGTLSIAASIEFIQSCDVVIANDSAPSHMAASQGVPVVSIFGPTTLDLGFRPWTVKTRIVQKNELECRPCGNHGHQKCPLKHHHCMVQIHPDLVIQAASDLMKNLLH